MSQLDKCAIAAIATSPKAAVVAIVSAVFRSDKVHQGRGQVKHLPLCHVYSVKSNLDHLSE